MMDRSGDKGNYLESSCSAMFIYSLFKAVRMGYIDQSYLDVALKGYEGFLKNFIEVDKEGVVTITCLLYTSLPQRQTVRKHR